MPREIGGSDPRLSRIRPQRRPEERPASRPAEDKKPEPGGLSDVGDSTGKKVEVWWGTCNAWSAPSIPEPEPQGSTTNQEGIRPPRSPRPGDPIPRSGDDLERKPPD